MSRPHEPLSDKHAREAQHHVAQQKALVHRMIAQGMPTQPAEDRLRQLQKTLAGMKGQHRPTRAFEVRQTVRHHRSR